MIGKPGSGRNTTGSFRSFTRVMQAKPFLPLMFMASEPQTPSRHDLRSDRLLSCALMRSNTSSSMRSLGKMSMS